MSLRLKAPLSVAVAVLALSACKDVKQVAQPDSFAIAGFQTTATPSYPASFIPTPNDLALQSYAAQSGLTRTLLGSFVTAGGFPSDQETPITIPVRTLKRNAQGAFVAGPDAPAGIDPASVNPRTVAIVRIDTNPPEVIAPEFGGYAPSAIPGVSNLIVRRAPQADGSRRWAPGGRYVVALRGGADGVRTTDGQGLGADTAIALIAGNKNLTIPSNQPPFTGIPDLNGNGTNQDEIASLEGLRALYNNQKAWVPVNDATVCGAAVPGTPFPAPCWLPAGPGGLPTAFSAVDRVFPSSELASIQTFVAAPAPAVTPLTDTGSGQIPFPSDFLLDTDPARAGLVRDLSSNPALAPAAAGLKTLDGFSTTSMLLQPLSGPVDATTITAANVLVFEETSSGATPLHDVATSAAGASYVLQPSALVSSGASTAIGIQPAVPVPTASGTVYVPPLKEKTTYVVVVTDGVKDLKGNAIARSTLGKLLYEFTEPLFDDSKPAGLKSQVPGVSDNDARALQSLKTGLAPLVASVESSTGKKVVMAYTMTTQTVTRGSIGASAAPYVFEQKLAAGKFLLSSVADFDPASVGLTAPTFTFPSVQKFVTAELTTFDALDHATGAFDPALAAWLATSGTNPPPANPPAERFHNVPVIIALPTPAALAAAGIANCPAPLPAVKCAPVVIFHHGFEATRLHMLFVAESLAAKGFIAAAIDAPFHGDRSFCRTNADCVTASGAAGTCVPAPEWKSPSDATAPGFCGNGSTLKIADGTNDTQPLAPVSSGSFFLSANFFRFRDGVRQDLIDQSALARAITRTETGANPIATATAASGYIPSPFTVSWDSLSLGSMVGTSAVATNPRFARAALDANGGTLADLYTSSPRFGPRLAALFATLGIDLAKVQAGDPVETARYLQAIIVTKWILDPAEPVNYAGHVATKIADPALVTSLGSAASTTTDAWGAVFPGDTAIRTVAGPLTTGDQTVPSPFGELVFQTGGLGYTRYTAPTVDRTKLHSLVLDVLPESEALRTDFANFLSAGTRPAADVTLP